MKFAKEFREFISKGNVLNLAVAVIIGGAFQAIINSLVNDIIMPIISIATGGIDFQNWFVALDGSHYATLAEAQEAGAATLNYGVFINAIIRFILMAIVIFIIVKIFNSAAEKAKKEEEAAAPTTKTCPYCCTEIGIDATRCPNCTSQLAAAVNEAAEEALKE